MKPLRPITDWPTRAFSLMLLLIFLALSLPALAQKKGGGKTRSKSAAREIAITFDELPVGEYFREVDRQAVTDTILKVLKAHKVKAVGFVVGSHIKGSYDLLGRWLNDGHRLGNLTLSYQDFNQLDAENFIKDIVAGAKTLESMLAGFGQKHRYFRYPFLHYGDEYTKKKRVESFLDEYNVRVAHATVVVEDYLYNLTVERTGGQMDSAAGDKLLNEYLNHVMDQIERSERLSKDILNRRCRQILQLKASQLNGMFLDEMLTAIERAGYRFITLDRALQDKLYDTDEAYIGMRGLGYLDMILLSDPDLLPAR